MKTKLVRIPMVLMFLSATSLAAAETPSAPAAEASKDEKEIVCKRQAPTGSRLTKKTCRSKKHLDEVAEKAKRNAREMIDGPVLPRCFPVSCS